MSDNQDLINALLTGRQEPQPAPDVANALAGPQQRSPLDLARFWADYIRPWGSYAAQQREPPTWTKDHPTLAAFLQQALTYAPLGLAPSLRAPMGGGVTMGDFIKASKMHGTAGRVGHGGKPDLGVTGGPTWEDPMGTPVLREWSYSRPLRNLEAPADPYDAAVALQAFARKAANSK